MVMPDLFYHAGGNIVPLEKRLGEFTLGLARPGDVQIFRGFYSARGFDSTPLLLRDYSILIITGPPSTSVEYIRKGVPRSDIRYITPVLQSDPRTKLLLLDDFRVGFHQQPSERALQEFLDQTGTVIKQKGNHHCTLTVADLDGTEIIEAVNRVYEMRELVKYADPHFVRVVPSPR